MEWFHLPEPTSASLPSSKRNNPRHERPHVAQKNNTFNTDSHMLTINHTRDDHAESDCFEINKASAKYPAKNRKDEVTCVKNYLFSPAPTFQSSMPTDEIFSHINDRTDISSSHASLHRHVDVVMQQPKTYTHTDTSHYPINHNSSVVFDHQIPSSSNSDKVFLKPNGALLPSTCTSEELDFLVITAGKFKPTNVRQDGITLVKPELCLPGPHYIVGMSCVYKNQEQIECGEFLDNHSFDNLSALVTTYRPAKEIYLVFRQNFSTHNSKTELPTTIINRVRSVCNSGSGVNLHDLQWIPFALGDLKIKWIEWRKKCSFVANQPTPPAWLFPGNSPDRSFLSDQYQAQSLRQVIDILTTKSNIMSTCVPTIHPYHLKHVLYMDNATLRALHIFPDPQDTQLNMSIYGLLNKNQTTMGDRLLFRWLLQPSNDDKVISKRLDVVQELIRLEDIQPIVKLLKTIPSNLDSIINRLLQVSIIDPAHLS
jgi:hypothetical protein